MLVYSIGYDLDGSTGVYERCQTRSNAIEVPNMNALQAMQRIATVAEHVLQQARSRSAEHDLHEHRGGYLPHRAADRRLAQLARRSDARRAVCEAPPAPRSRRARRERPKISVLQGFLAIPRSSDRRSRIPRSRDSDLLHSPPFAPCSVQVRSCPIADFTDGKGVKSHECISCESLPPGHRRA